MTFLPIVGRELRVTARRLGTYWTRVAMASGATVVGAFILLFSLNAAPQQVGYYIFVGLSALSILFCLSYGRQATADCLSSEKRQGTLGLLFLTDLKGHDVVLGKLAATSLGGFYGLLAVFPVLAIPLLMGGITSGEFWRIVLVLVDTFLFSLSIGIFVSSFTWDARRAVGTNFLLLLLLAGIPPAVGFAIAALKSGPIMRDLFLTCPVYTFYLSLAAPYRANPQHFWKSLVIIHALTWMLLALASKIAPLGWQDRPAQPSAKNWKTRWRFLSYGTALAQKAFRDKALDVNAFYWLAARARLKPAHVWVFLLSMGLWWLAGWATAGHIWFDIFTYVITGVLLNTTLKIWLMIEASQRLADDHKAGALELLLSTPLSVADVLRGQWLALRRQFAGPLVATLAVELLLLQLSRNRSDGPEVVPVWVAGMVMLTVDMAAAGWVAMWLALNVKKPHQAALGATVRILVLPWVAVGLVSGFLSVWFQLSATGAWDPGWRFFLSLWVGFGLAADIIFGLSARSRLRSSFRTRALEQLVAPSHQQDHWHRRGIRLRRTPHPTGLKPVAQPAPQIRTRLRNRRILITVGAGLAAAVMLIGFWVHRSNSFPEPPLITIQSAAETLRVFPDHPGLLLILPDNSLWTWPAWPAGGTFKQATVQRLGTGYAWRKAAGGFSDVIGLRSDGTLWEWPKLPGGAIGTPTQFDTREVWVDVARLSSGSYAAAVHKDGTLWGWGNIVNRRSGMPPTPAKVGTNDNWAAVCANQMNMIALQKDGSLWVWGSIVPFAPNTPGRQITIAEPARLCHETNWMGFIEGNPVLPRTASAEAWEISGMPPDAGAPAGAVCRLISTNAPVGRFATAYADGRKAYEIRPDGTLWERNCPAATVSFTGPEPWRRVGRRSDWVSLNSAGATAVGLTADGTLWIWGYDPSQPTRASVVTGLKMIQARIAAIFSNPSVNFGRGSIPVFQKEPRPIMRIVVTRNSTY